MPKFAIATFWHVAATLIVEAADLKAAISAVEDDDEMFKIEDIEKTSEYIDGSFTVNRDCCEETDDEEIAQMYPNERVYTITQTFPTLGN